MAHRLVDLGSLAGAAGIVDIKDFRPAPVQAPSGRPISAITS